MITADEAKQIRNDAITLQQTVEYQLRHVFHGIQYRAALGKSEWEAITSLECQAVKDHKTYLESLGYVIEENMSGFYGYYTIRF